MTIISDERLTYYGKRLFERLSDKYGGDTTINEIRVMSQALVCHETKHDCTVTTIANELGIHKATVSRAVNNLTNKGWLTSSPDPHDARRRFITLSEKSIARKSPDWADCRSWLTE